MVEVSLDPAKHNLIYLASPYSKYITLNSACRDISLVAGRLIRRGYRVFSPIAHSHTIALHAGIDPLDHDLWLKFDESFMGVCDALMIAMMDGWEASDGVARELKFFEGTGKPLYYLNPNTLRMVTK